MASLLNDYIRAITETNRPSTESGYRPIETRCPLRQYQKPTDEAVQRAIDWLEAEKESAQNDWERSGAEWRMEPGTQEQHDERMAAFDLAIQALRQMRKPENDVPNVIQDSLQDGK